MHRNYLVYNLQHGNKVVVGQSTGGILNITSAPLFYDGSYNVRLTITSLPLSLLTAILGSFRFTTKCSFKS